MDNTIASAQDGKVRGNFRGETLASMRRLRVSFYHRTNLYAGSKADLIAAGLVAADQCPDQQGDPYAVEYNLEGAEASCSLHDIAEGVYWVSVENPQPTRCTAVLKAVGDPAALDQLLSAHLGVFLALDDIARRYESLPTSVETNSEVVSLFANKLGDFANEAAKLHKSNPAYQAAISEAEAAMEKLRRFSDPITDSISREDISLVLCGYVRAFGLQVSEACERGGVNSGIDWSSAVE